MLTVREAIAKGAEFLRNKGVDSARLDAELLVGEATGMNRLQLYLNLDRPLNEPERDRARELLRRRGLREPVAYILGKREFRSREFQVSPAVLIPRPETELLVEQAEQELSKRFAQAEGQYRLLELGAGSGAICVSLAADLANAHIIATEISPQAAEVARQNAQHYGVESRIDLRVQNDFRGITGPFHAIVSNPPYVPEADRPTLSPEVGKYEPAQALFAPDEGTAVLRQLLRQAPGLLLPEGFLLCEIGFGQSARLRTIAEEESMQVEAFLPDYAGIERMMLAVPRKG